jgi:hypothetical protein
LNSSIAIAFIATNLRKEYYLKTTGPLIAFKQIVTCNTAPGISEKRNG